MTPDDRFREEGMSPEERKKLEELIDKLMKFISSQPGDGSDDGASIGLRLVPVEPESSDPRIIEAIQAESEARDKREPPNGDDDGTLEVEYNANFISPDAVEQQLTSDLDQAVGPTLRRQRDEALAKREKTGRRAASLEDRVQARRDLRDAKGGLEIFLTSMMNYCGDRIREGCKWWEEELPGPLKTLLNGLLVGGAATAVIAAPVTTGICAVAVVALVTRRRRTPGDRREEDREDISA